MMKIKIIFLFCLLVSNYGLAHNEILGELTFSNYQGELYVRANLEKKHFIHVLKSEGDCPSEKMISECGERYINQSIQVKVNNEDAVLKRKSLEVGKDYIVWLFQIGESYKVLNSLSVNSIYMLKYNDHGILHVKIVINEFSASYNMSAKRKSINVNLN